MQANINTKYTAAALAGIFKVPPALMRELLAELMALKKIDCVSNHSKHFFIPQEKKEPFQSFKFNKPFKPLVLPKGIGERCRELYPEGHSFGNMSGGKS